MLKSNKGITLIALVITIIVLLILAGVSIAMLTGNNGVLTKARESEIMNKRGEISEKINLALQGIMSDILKDLSTSEDGESIYFTEPKYGPNDILKDNNMKDKNGSNPLYEVSTPSQLGEPELPKGEKVYAFVICWKPETYDTSGKYGKNDSDIIWGAITYEADATDKVPFKADCPAKASMSQASLNDLSDGNAGKYYAGKPVKQQ